jgi:hypothetical protein
MDKNLEEERLRRKFLISKARRRLKEKSVNYKGGCCSICGYDKCLKALQFHHLDPNEKDFAISHCSTTKWEVVREELDKCILVCSNCHFEIHDEEQSLEYEKIKIELNISERNMGQRKCNRCKNIFSCSSAKERICEECKKETKNFRIKDSIEYVKKIVKENTLVDASVLLNCSPTGLKKFCLRNNIEISSQFIREKINWPEDEKLSKMVFEKPLIKLAEDLGVSDNAIKKRCKNKGIELPPRGFWLKKQ